jgi:phospholipid/cholesterol/gamma-HCH transport system substrate-binding protein
MKISNETKVGLLTIIALTLLIVGFNFLKGKDIFDRSNKIYAVFSDLGTLEKSNEVKINGLSIGTVYDKKEIDKNVSGIIVTIRLTRDINIPKNSVAFISSGLIGSSYLVIERGNSPELLQPGDTLRTRQETGILGDVKAQLNPTLARVKDVLDSLKGTLSGINNVFDEQARRNLSLILTNLQQTSRSLNTLLDSESGALAKTLNNAQSITENIRNNNDSINATISNARRASEKLASLEIQPTIDSLSGAVGELKALIGKLNSKDGTLGALMNDKELYNKLWDAILSAEILMDDLRTNPKRYVNISVFGKKDKKGPITSPAKKDTLPSGGN